MKRSITLKKNHICSFAAAQLNLTEQINLWHKNQMELLKTGTTPAPSNRHQIRFWDIKTSVFIWLFFIYFKTVSFVFFSFCLLFFFFLLHWKILLQELFRAIPFIKLSKRKPTKQLEFNTKRLVFLLLKDLNAKFSDNIGKIRENTFQTFKCYYQSPCLKPLCSKNGFGAYFRGVMTEKSFDHVVF